MMTASIDRNACTGCGLCVDTCPDVFGFDDGWLAIVKVSPVPPGNANTCRDAAHGCPVNAISIDAQEG